MPTYPLSLPSELKPTDFYLRREHKVARTYGEFSFAVQTQVHAGIRWVLDLSFAPISDQVSSLTAWATATAYTAGQQRSTGGVNYECLTNHTSGTFSTDFAAGKWKRIEVFAAIGFYQDLQGKEGSVSLDLSDYDASVSGETTTSFQLAEGKDMPGWKKKEGIYYFDPLNLEEVI